VFLAVLLSAALAPGVSHADEQTKKPPKPWFIGGVYTATSQTGELGPPMAFAVAGVDRFSVKFLNIGPWWEVIPRYHVPIDRKLKLSVGAGIQQFRGTIYPRVEVGARGKLGDRGFYSAALEVDATHTPIPGGVGWGGLFKSGATFDVGQGAVQAFVRYEGGGIGGGPAIAYRLPVGAPQLRFFVSSAFVKGDSSTRSLIDFTFHPLSAVGGMSMRF
jgi:hypothetical protein